MVQNVPPSAATIFFRMRLVSVVGLEIALPPIFVSVLQTLEIWQEFVFQFAMENSPGQLQLVLHLREDPVFLRIIARAIQGSLAMHVRYLYVSGYFLTKRLYVLVMDSVLPRILANVKLAMLETTVSSQISSGLGNTVICGAMPIIGARP